MSRIRSLVVLSLSFALFACSAGDDGAAGTDGQDGQSILFSSVAEPAGVNCTFGGFRIEAGTDTNSNGILETTEITSSEYVCNGADPDASLGFDLVKPANNSPIASDTRVSYTLAEEVQSLTFTRTLFVGSGSDAAPVVLSGADVTAGYHENVPLSGEVLLEGDIYSLTIEALTLDGATVALSPAFGLVVDNTAPTLIKAQAVQSEFGRWNVGDRLVFTFSEAMDQSTFGGLDTFTRITQNLPDVSGNGYDYFSYATQNWSSDGTILTLWLYTEQTSPSLLEAGSSGDVANASFNPTDSVRDAAGNIDATPLDIELTSTGDVTVPVSWINSPKSNSTISTDAVVEYTLSEDLRSGSLIITLQSGGAIDPQVTRTWTLDASRRAAGTRSVNIVTEGLAPLVDGAYYSFTIDGEDGAGNRVRYEVSSVQADSTAPVAPDASVLFVRNHTNEVAISAAQSDAAAGDTLRLYIDGVLTAEALFPGPYGATQSQTLISGLPTIAAGATISYSYVDEAGNESTKSSDGSMPSAPTATDATNLGVRVGSSAYELIADAPLAANSEVHVVFNGLPATAVLAGDTDAGGNFTPVPNALSDTLVNPGTTVSYLYRDPASGHYSAYSVADGSITQLLSVAILDFDYSATVSPYDLLEMSFSAEVVVPASTSDFSYGASAATVGT